MQQTAGGAWKITVTRSKVNALDIVARVQIPTLRSRDQTNQAPKESLGDEEHAIWDCNYPLVWKSARLAKATSELLSFCYLHLWSSAFLGCYYLQHLGYLGFGPFGLQEVSRELTEPPFHYAFRRLPAPLDGVRAMPETLGVFQAQSNF